VRRKDPSQLVAEVEQAVRRDGVESAYLIDLEFHLGGATSRGFCRSLAETRLPLRWCCELRPREVGDDFLDDLAAGGCRLVHCGIESGSPERLEVLDKVGRLEDMVDGVHRILGKGSGRAARARAGVRKGFAHTLLRRSIVGRRLVPLAVLVRRRNRA